MVRGYTIEHLADEDAVLMIQEADFLKQGKSLPLNGSPADVDAQDSSGSTSDCCLEILGDAAALAKACRREGSLADGFEHAGRAASVVFAGWLSIMSAVGDAGRPTRFRTIAIRLLLQTARITTN